VVEFDQKVIAITGAAGGIGQSMCQHFGALGAAIAAVDVRPRVTELVEGLRSARIKSAAAVTDVGDPNQVKDGFAALAAALGPVDILINNAGFSQRPSLDRSTPETWRDDINCNLNGAFNCAHAVLPTMLARRTGAIVNIGSVNGVYALGDPAYSAAKAGLINFTKSLAMEYGRFGIRANIILPGTVRTPLWVERASRNPKILSDLIRWYPLGRIVDPIDVTRAAAFLVSDAAAAITGAVLPVDCGLSAGNIAMARELTLEPY
jgi:NAD(P)-dependent dehydrogenase (short-subunit alcohol dehydrogenase family)